MLYNSKKNNWRQSECSSITKWWNKVRYIHATDYEAIQKNNRAILINLEGLPRCSPDEKGMEEESAPMILFL